MCMAPSLEPAPAQRLRPAARRCTAHAALRHQGPQQEHFARYGMLAGMAMSAGNELEAAACCMRSLCSLPATTAGRSAPARASSRASLAADASEGDAGAVRGLSSSPEGAPGAPGCPLALPRREELRDLVNPRGAAAAWRLLASSSLGKKYSCGAGSALVSGGRALHVQCVQCAGPGSLARAGCRRRQALLHSDRRQCLLGAVRRAGSCSRQAHADWAAPDCTRSQ